MSIAGRSSSLVACVILGSVLGCGGTTQASTPADSGGASLTDSGVADTGNGADANSNDGFVPVATFTVNYPAEHVAPGGESTMCVILPVGNANAVHIGRIHNALSPGSHHLIVYKTEDTAPTTTPFKCIPFADLLGTNKGTPLMITQKKDDVLQLPDTVGVTFNPNQFVRLEFHTINTTAAPLDITASVEFDVLPESLYQNELGFFFMGDPDIDIPAHSALTLGPIFSPVPDLLSGVNWFGITGHEHQWGTNVQVWTESAPTGGTEAKVYDVPAWDWASPATVWASPSFHIPDGGGFKFQCDWQNNGDTQVKFGESATNEMCFFWAYYWPAETAQVCVHTDKLNPSGPLDLCCPGISPICDIIQSKLAGSP
ncbi:MAG: hypothetical protein ACHREM_17490 [Polyangiales bacterium]